MCRYPVRISSAALNIECCNCVAHAVHVSDDVCRAKHPCRFTTRSAYKLGKRKCSYNQVELQLVSIVNSMLSCERAVSQDDAGSTPGTNRPGAGGAPPPLRVERMVEDPFAGLAADDDALAIIGNADADSNYVSFSFSVEGGRQLSLQAFVVQAHPEEIPGEGGAREIREDARPPRTAETRSVTFHGTTK